MNTPQPTHFSGQPVRSKPGQPSAVRATGSVTDWPDALPDINQPVVFQRLLSCLCYALAIDDSVALASALGMPASLSNQAALSLWVRHELRGVQFLDGSALFNFLVRQLDNLIGDHRGNL